MDNFGLDYKFTSNTGWFRSSNVVYVEILGYEFYTYNDLCFFDIKHDKGFDLKFVIKNIDKVEASNEEYDKNLYQIHYEDLTAIIKGIGVGNGKLQS